MLARNIKYIEDQKTVINDPKLAKEIRNNIIQGDIYIAKRVFRQELIRSMRDYLAGVGKNSLPNYHGIEIGAPNFHRLNIWDERSYVKACFHQFSFFPWNQDVLNLFEITKEVYYMKNILSDIPKDKFMGRNGEDGCISRLSFQFYPSGSGGLNKHQDPVDHHQLTVPALTMSKKGVDFKEGGAYVDTENNSKIYLDEVSDVGDVVYFNALTPHGVEMIDPKEKLNWLSFKGRWMLLFAINKVAGNSKITNSIDLEKK